MKIEIKHLYSGEVLFSHECEDNTIKVTVREAVKVGANLRKADLSGVDLSEANLSKADLIGVNLSGVDLRWVDLREAKLGDFTLIGSRPVIQLGSLGSRSDTLLAFITDDGIKIKAGCFFGSAEKFEGAVQVEHGDSEHGREYRAALAFIRVHAEIWTPK